MKYVVYCTCGDSANGSGSVRALEKFDRAWHEVHSGPGHAPCDRKTAANARRRRDRAERKDGAK